VSAEWSRQKLSDICQLRPPKSEARATLSDGDAVSFVPMNDLPIREKRLYLTSEKALGKVYGGYTYFADGDVLLAKITPCFENGKLGIARGLKNGIGFGSSEFFVLRPGNRVDPEFLFYFLCQDTFLNSMKRVMSGAVGHKRVPKEFIEALPLQLPTLQEQKRIVAILDEAFAGIETAIANTEKNLDNARELFNSYLSLAIRRGLELSKQSDLDQFVKFIDYRGRTPKKVDSGLRLITAKNVRMGYLQREPEEFVDPESYDSWMTRGIPGKGDVLFTTEAPLGYACQLDTDS
jgi:type I restriction enzyme, S subunit